MSLFSLRLTFPGVVAAVVVAVIATACSSTKHVPEGEYLLDDVSIEVTDRNDIDKVELYNFLRQQPNRRAIQLSPTDTQPQGARIRAPAAFHLQSFGT